MSDLIDRQAAIDAFEDTSFTKTAIRRILSEVPSEEPERKKAKYLATEDSKWLRCSNCGADTRFIKKYNVPNYCPNCGAYMRGDDNGVRHN